MNLSMSRLPRIVLVGDVYYVCGRLRYSSPWQ
jgi:hypothetical protein